jgi:iron complex outermembrane receptor protein
MKRIFWVLCLLPYVRGLAQDQEPRKDTLYYLSPVVVTATQAFERLSPVVFSDLTRLEIKQRYSVQDVPVLLSELPSIIYYSENGNGMGYNYINMRGFDQRRISVMVNGVPQNDPEDHNVYWIDFPDLLASTQTIQVQRGAGSAFYGPPAIGGSVNIVANPFTQEPGVTLETMLGFQELGGENRTALSTKKFSVAMNSGLVNNRYMLYGRLAKLQTDGYREKSWVDMNSYFLGAVRFDEEMTTRLHFYGGPFSDGLVYTGLPKFVNTDVKLRRLNFGDWGLDSTENAFSYNVPRRTQETESFSQPHFELLHTWRLSRDIALDNTVFLVTGEGFFDYDASWADTSLLRIGSKYGFPANQNPANSLVRGFVRNNQWGWLPRVTIDHGEGTLTLGAELRVHRSLHWGKIQYAEGLPANFDPDYHFYEYRGEKDILSLYAHEMYRWREDFSVMADLQFVYNRYGLTNEKYLNNAFTLPYYFLNPRLGINFNIDGEWNTFMTIAYTSREPRLRNLYAAEDSYFGASPQFAADTASGVVRYDFTQPIAKPERLLDVETGLGYRSAVARFNVNLFWMEFADELVKSGQVDIFGQPVTGNAEKTRHIGLEFDWSFVFNQSWSVSGNFTLSRNRLVHYKDFTGGNLKPLDGNPIAGFPDVLGSMRVTYSGEMFMASVIGKYVGSFYTDNFKNEAKRNDDYLVFNAETVHRLSGFGMTLRGEVRNIFNRLYLMSGEGNAFFPAAERNYILGLTVQI